MSWLLKALQVFGDLAVVWALGNEDLKGSLPFWVGLGANKIWESKSNLGEGKETSVYRAVLSNQGSFGPFNTARRVSFFFFFF